MKVKVTTVHRASSGTRQALGKSRMLHYTLVRSTRQAWPWASSSHRSQSHSRRAKAGGPQSPRAGIVRSAPSTTL
eukprot:1780946-Amphidinium_carterae.1